MKNTSYISAFKKCVILGIPILLGLFSGASFFLAMQPGGDLGALLFLAVGMAGILLLIFYVLWGCLLFKLFPHYSCRNITDIKALFMVTLLLVGWIFFSLALATKTSFFGFLTFIPSNTEFFNIFILGGILFWSILTFLFYRYPNFQWKHFLGMIFVSGIILFGVYVAQEFIPNLFQSKPKSGNKNMLDNILKDSFEELDGVQIIKIQEEQ